MSENEEKKTYSLNHFAAVDLTHSFWDLEADARREKVSKWIEGLKAAGSHVHFYQSNPLEQGTELLVWSAVPVETPDAPRRFFQCWSKAAAPLRPYLVSRHTLWGFTRPSTYSKAKSSQEIDPFSNDRSPYLVMYPFTKTADWYLLGAETRQGMMNEHMRIGKGYREITQLLLYSFGLQDQEFVVVYETDDLQMFSQLVYDLRDTEARRYTKGDTPLHTGVYVTEEELLRHFE